VAEKNDATTQLTTDAAASSTDERRVSSRKFFHRTREKNNNNNGDTASCLCNSSSRVYVINDHVYVFFPHALYACNLLIYNNNVHTYIRRRNARPVNINHVTRSRTIIRSAAAMLHIIIWRRLRLRQLWSTARKIIFFPDPHLIGGKRKNVFVRPPATAVRLFLRRRGCSISVYTYSYKSMVVCYISVYTNCLRCFLYANFPVMCI